MSTTTSGSARASLFQQYSRGSSGAVSSSSSAIENLPPRTLSRVAKEVRDLIKNPPGGIRLVVDSETGLPTNLGEIVAELEGPQGTPYESKFFQLKLVLGVDFPQAPPRGFFLTKIYHPNVDMSTGAICVNTLKKDWTAATTFTHVLSVIRCLLIIPFPESSLNDEAGKLFMESYDEYSKRALLMADVHGRPGPSCIENDEKRKKTEEDDKETEGEPSPSSKRKTGNPLGSKNSNSLSTSEKGTTVSQKGSGDRLTKKKSLKRL